EGPGTRVELAERHRAVPEAAQDFLLRDEHAEILAQPSGPFDVAGWRKACNSRMSCAQPAASASMSCSPIASVAALASPSAPLSVSSAVSEAKAREPSTEITPFSASPLGLP